MKSETKKIIFSLKFPIYFAILFFFIKIIEIIFFDSFVEYGVLPREKEGLIGIVTAPLIHGSFSHLFSNIPPFLVLSIGIFYFYERLAYRIFFSIYFFSNILVWLFARSSYHIGASGIVYGMASFLFVSGIIRKSKRLLALSLLIVFWYGSMIWGIIPMKIGVSWESHLFGMLVGILISFYFKSKSLKHSKKEEKTNYNYSSDKIEVEYSLDKKTKK